MIPNLVTQPLANLAFILTMCLVTYSCPSDATPQHNASYQARLTSCESATVRSVLDDILRDPQTLRDPLVLFHAASAAREIGLKEDAAFLYLAAKLRVSRQILFEQGDRPQLLAVMNMTLGPMIAPLLAADPALAQRTVTRTVSWDQSTPDPFRDREDAKLGEIAKKITDMNARLALLPAELQSDSNLMVKAREMNEAAEHQIKAAHAQRCGPGTLDPVDAEVLAKRIKIQAELFAKAHPLVQSRATVAVNSTSVGSYREGVSRLPGRMTITVSPASGKAFYAEVDATTSITAERKLESVRFSLACLTDFGLGQRDALWKDVCTGDPNAIKPPPNGDASLKRFNMDADGKSEESPPVKPICGFSELALPADFSLFAAGAYSGRKAGYQIDQSGHEATRIDVAVNTPTQPVVLILGAYEPTIWNLSWTKQTKILAVLIGGYHRQVVAGLEKNVPVLVSSYDNKGPCGYFYITRDDMGSLNPIARRVFGKPVEMVYLATEGKAVVGQPIPREEKLLKSTDVTPESFYDKTAPLSGPAGLEDAVRKGLLRKATIADVEAWSDAVIANTPSPDVPPIAGQGIQKPPRPPVHDAFVVLKPFTYPAGLYGGNSAFFLIPKGVPRPQGNPGHSNVYDFNTLKCEGSACQYHFR